MVETRRSIVQIKRVGKLKTRVGYAYQGPRDRNFLARIIIENFLKGANYRNTR